METVPELREISLSKLKSNSMAGAADEIAGNCIHLRASPALTPAGHATREPGARSHRAVRERRRRGLPRPRMALTQSEDVACLMHRSHHVQLVQMYRNSSHLVQCVHPSALALPKDSECTSVGLLNTVGSPSPGRRSVGSPGRGRHPIAGSERGVLVPVRAAVRRSGFARCPLAGTRQDVPGQPVMPRARHGAHAGACRTRPRHSSPWSGHFPVVLVLALEPGHFRPGRTIDTATTPGSSLRFSGSRCAHSASDCRSPDSLRWPG